MPRCNHNKWITNNIVLWRRLDVQRWYLLREGHFTLSLEMNRLDIKEKQRISLIFTCCVANMSPIWASSVEHSINQKYLNENWNRKQIYILIETTKGVQKSGFSFYCTSMVKWECGCWGHSTGLVLAFVQLCISLLSRNSKGNSWKVK